MRTLFLSCICILSLVHVRAQDYFQQEVNYQINVSLNDKEHSLTAFETIQYTNNSPDDLNKIYFHIWPNAYRNNQTALGKQKLVAGGKRMNLDAPHQQGWIDSLDFKVNGQQINWDFDPEHIDICVLELKEPLTSGQGITITTPFYVKLPKGTMSRLGHLEQSYQITQWYPKPAVYDNKGWHAFPYLDIGEFYSEYGSFQVSITVPENYIVAATGNLQDESQRMELVSLAEKNSQMSEFDKSDKAFPTTSENMKTLVYSESNVHDFAWFADKRFHVLKGEVMLPGSGRTVTTWAYFPNHQADLWKDAIEYINDAVYYYSLWYGDYPYNNCSAVHVPNSRGGMEYPTVTIIGNNSTPMALETVVMHEVGHNWFYGILGSNERDYPWMDEGINTFSEMRYFNAKYPDNKLYPFQMKSESQASLAGIEAHPYSYIHQVLYRLQARRNMDLPTNSCSEELAGFNYSAIAYSKTGLSFYYLKEYLGEERFDEVMQAYFERWKFKHPYPEDLKAIFEEFIEEDLSWFFDDLMSTDKKLDYRIVRTSKDKVLVKNKGQIASPVLINAFTEDSLIAQKWMPGFEGKQWIEFPTLEQQTHMRLFGYTYPDLRPTNDASQASGLFKKIEPLRFKLLGAIEDPERSTINILPAPAWNYHNGFMLGAYLHNDVLPLSKFEYQVLPMYSFGTQDLAGLAELRLNLHPYSSKIQRISPYLRLKQFALTDRSGDYYQKVSSGLEFRFKRKVNNIPTDNELTLDYTYATDLSDFQSGDASNFAHFYQVRFEQLNRERINPHRFEVAIQGSDGFVKSSLVGEYKHTYIYKNSLDIRVFAGVFLDRNEGLSPVYNFYAGGTVGANDYTYDGLFLGRSLSPDQTLFISNQFNQDQGGFASFSPMGQSSEFLIALNLASSLPITKELPFQLYGSAAYLGDGPDEFNEIDQESLLYEVGVKVHVVRKVLEFYFPLLASRGIQDYQEETTNNYWQNVRFTFNLNKLNLHELAKDI